LKFEIDVLLNRQVSETSGQRLVLEYIESINSSAIEMRVNQITIS